MLRQQQLAPEHAVGRLGKRAAAATGAGAAELGGVVAVADAASTKDQPGGIDAGGRRRVGSALEAWWVMSRFGDS